MRTIVMGAPSFNPEPTATAHRTRRTVAGGSGLNERKHREARGVGWRLCALALLASVAPARAADKAPKATYDEHVVPILREKCFACHNQDRKSGGLRLNNFTNVMTGGASGEIIKPGDPDGSLLYRLATHQQEPHMPPKSAMLPKESLETIRKWIQAGAPENAGSRVVVANKPKMDIALSSVTKGKPDGPPPMPHKLSLEPTIRTARANALTALAASPWAPLVAVGGQKQVLLYHSDTLDLLGVLPFPEGVPYVLKFSRNSSLLLAGGGHSAKSGRVVVWNVTTGQRVFEVGEELDAVLAADISADQTQIALGGPSKVVRVYSTKEGKLLHEIKKHTDWIYAIEYSPDGVLLATGDRNGGLFVWESHTAREYFSLRGHTAAITDVSWRSDSNVLASGSEDGTVRLWEMENGGQVKGWGAGGGVASVKYARDGRLVACTRDRLTRVWDQNGAQVRAFEAFPDLALRGAFSHDGGRVIAGDWSGTIRVWSTTDGKLAGQLSPNPRPVAEQLELALKELSARETAYKPLAAAAAASQAAAEKATAELASAQQDASDTAAAAKIVAEAVVRAKETADRANAPLAAAQAHAAARETMAKSYAETAAKVQEAAGKAKDNKGLAAAAATSRDVAAAAVTELATAQKTVASLLPAARAANEHLASAQRAAVFTSSAAAAAAKVLEPRAPIAKATAAKAAADKAAADAVGAALTTLRATVDRYKSALATARAK
jgi:WD40 repeat protein